MSIITTKKHERKNITARMCEARVAKQTKHYDRRVSGLYVSVNPTAPATFFLKFTDPNTHQRSSIRIGVYHSELFTIEMARIKAMALKARIGNGEDVVQSRRQAKTLQAKLSGVTVNQVIDERIAWMSTKVRKADGELRARIESWESVDRIFDRFVRPRLGTKIASEVTARDIAELSDDIVAGKLGKASVANARHMRRAASGLFKWAAQPSRGYVSASPCINLEPLDKEPPRTRRLSPDEIRTLWHGLDRPDIAIDRRICLAIKFALASMLRSTELLHIHRDELVDLDRSGDFFWTAEKVASSEHRPKFPRVDVPMKRVKKRRPIHQPLSGLAVELINEAMQPPSCPRPRRDDQAFGGTIVPASNQAFVFAGRFGDAPLHRLAMANALRGCWRISNGKRVVKSVGICERLGLKPFTPHDLRRTAASLMGSIGIPRSTVALCLDHAPMDDSGGAVPKVTGVYDTDPRLKEKREALEKLAAEIRRITGFSFNPVEVKGVDRIAA